NGDSLQILFTDAERTTVTQLYNVALGGTDDALGTIDDISMSDLNQQPSGDGLTPHNDFIVVRDTTNKKTYYELKFPAASLGFTNGLVTGMQFGLGLCANDGDDSDPSQNGQKGWAGWGAHSIVFGKTASEAGLVTLRSGPCHEV